MIKKYTALGFLLLVSFDLFGKTTSKPVAPTASPTPVSPERLLEQAEAIRNPTENYTVDVQLVDKNKGVEETRTYECSVKGPERALVKYLTPAVEKGTKVLMVAGDMWVFIPSSAKPIRISPKQKLAGNAAYGDVTRLSFLGNYKPTILREDIYQGKAVIVLDLAAIDGKPVTYDKIEYWIEKITKKPIRAYYQTVAGKTLREGYFEKYENIFGVQRPTAMRLIDHIIQDHVTVMTFANAKMKDLPEELFEKQNLGRN